MIKVNLKRLSKILISLTFSILFFFLLFKGFPPVFNYILPGSYGPSSKSELCKVLQRGGKEIDCEEQMRMDDMLEEAFPAGTTTRAEVRSILDAFWLDTFTITRNDEKSVIDAYAITFSFPLEPDQAFFSFSQDGFLQQISYHSG